MIFKRKNKKEVFDEKFAVCELSFPAKTIGTSGDLSKPINIINSDKPYPQVFLGFGWNILLDLLGTKVFDASVEDKKEQSSIYDARDLTSLTIGAKKWTEAKR